MNEQPITHRDEKLAKKRLENIAKTKAHYESIGYNWNPTTGQITRRVPKTKGKAAVKAHKRERQAARRNGVKFITVG